MHLVNSGATAIAYETVEVNGTLPLLAPMSEVAGRLAGSDESWCWRYKSHMVVVECCWVAFLVWHLVEGLSFIGGGVAGLNAAVIAVGMGADVIVFDRSSNRLQYIDTVYGGRIKTLVASKHAIEREVKQADLVVGAVLLVHGAKAPKPGFKMHWLRR
jgi:alanine dehydrogenase